MTKTEIKPNLVNQRVIIDFKDMKDPVTVPTNYDYRFGGHDTVELKIWNKPLTFIEFRSDYTCGCFYQANYIERINPDSSSIRIGEVKILEISTDSIKVEMKVTYYDKHGSWLYELNKMTTAWVGFNQMYGVLLEDKIYKKVKNGS